MRDGNLYDNSTEQIFVKCLASSRHDARFEDERKKFCKAAAKALQSCPSLCDPTDGSPQAPLSTGFSRQEYWSGLPFPST